jgi:methylthioribulose-1-phosphate dehydratase
MKSALSYLDTLEVPIIENTPHEEDLTDSMADAMKQYPDAAAVLVRRHGIYVWGTARPVVSVAVARCADLTFSHAGSDWEKAKTQTEVCRHSFCAIGPGVNGASRLLVY